MTLQIAAESGHQESLDILFARRSRSQTMRLGLLLIALFFTLPLMNLVCDPPPPARKPESKERQPPPEEKKP